MNAQVSTDKLLEDLRMVVEDAELTSYRICNFCRVSNVFKNVLRKKLSFFSPTS